jgi:hypothetical protein
VNFAPYSPEPCELTLAKAWVKTPMQLASAWALLAVKQLAGVLTRRSRSGTGLHGRFRDEDASGISAWRSESRTVEETSRPGYWTRRLCNTFFDNGRGRPHTPLPPPMIMLLIVRFPTRQDLCRSGLPCCSRQIEELRQDIASRTGNRPVRVQAEPLQPIYLFVRGMLNRQVGQPHGRSNVADNGAGA